MQHCRSSSSRLLAWCATLLLALLLAPCFDCAPPPSGSESQPTFSLSLGDESPLVSALLYSPASRFTTDPSASLPLLFLSSTSGVRAFDPETGRSLWNESWTSPPSPETGADAAATPAGQMLLDDDGALWVLNPSLELEQWVRQDPGHEFLISRRIRLRAGGSEQPHANPPLEGTVRSMRLALISHPSGSGTESSQRLAVWATMDGGGDASKTKTPSLWIFDLDVSEQQNDATPPQPSQQSQRLPLQPQLQQFRRQETEEQLPDPTAAPGESTETPANPDEQSPTGPQEPAPTGSTTAAGGDPPAASSIQVCFSVPLTGDAACEANADSIELLVPNEGLPWSGEQAVGEDGSTGGQEQGDDRAGENVYLYARCDGVIVALSEQCTVLWSVDLTPQRNPESSQAESLPIPRIQAVSATNADALVYLPRQWDNETSAMVPPVVVRLSAASDGSVSDEVLSEPLEAGGRRYEREVQSVTLVRDAQACSSTDAAILSRCRDAMNIVLYEATPIDADSTESDKGAQRFAYLEALQPAEQAGQDDVYLWSTLDRMRPVPGGLYSRPFVVQREDWAAVYWLQRSPTLDASDQPVPGAYEQPTLYVLGLADGGVMRSLNLSALDLPLRQTVQRGSSAAEGEATSASLGCELVDVSFDEKRVLLNCQSLYGRLVGVSHDSPLWQLAPGHDDGAGEEGGDGGAGGEPDPDNDEGAGGEQPKEPDPADPTPGDEQGTTAPAQPDSGEQTPPDGTTSGEGDDKEEEKEPEEGPENDDPPGESPTGAGSETDPGAVTAPAGTTDGEEKPADDKPADDKPADDKPSDDKPADETPAGGDSQGESESDAGANTSTGTERDTSVPPTSDADKDSSVPALHSIVTAFLSLLAAALILILVLLAARWWRRRQDLSGGSHHPLRQRSPRPGAGLMLDGTIDPDWSGSPIGGVDFGSDEPDGSRMGRPLTAHELELMELEEAIGAGLSGPNAAEFADEEDEDLERHLEREAAAENGMMSDKMKLHIDVDSASPNLNGKKSGSKKSSNGKAKRFHRAAQEEEQDDAISM